MIVRLGDYLEGRGFEELREMVPMFCHNNNNVSSMLNSTKPNQRDADDATGAVGSLSHRRIDSSNGVDSISSLPDEILQTILSSLPTKFAIRTSVLSKRWKLVWHDTPSCDFEWYDYRVNPDSINKTLECYKSPKMMSFRLCTGMKENFPYIDTWIEFAMSRNVENLSLSFSFDGSYNDSFPDFFYLSSSIKQLRVNLGFYDMRTPRCSVSWTSLKKLSLRACILSDECIAKILSGCPILESLSLYLCGKLSVLDLSKSVHLKSLEIDPNNWAPGPMQVVAPHIHRLRLKISQLPVTLVDVSSLTEANLDIDSYLIYKQLEDDLHVMVLKMLEKLCNVEKLTFGANFLKILSLSELCRVPFPMIKVKDLAFETRISQYVIPGIVRVLENSPELKKLTVQTTKDTSTIPKEYLDSYLYLQGLDSDRCWSSEARIFDNIFLSNVEPKHMASFMELMLKHTKTLEKMVVSLKGYLKGKGFEELLEMVPMISHNNYNVSVGFTWTKPNQKGLVLNLIGH